MSAEISVANFHLIMKALEREYAIDPKKFEVGEQRLVFNKDNKLSSEVVIEPAGYNGTYYVQLGGHMFKCNSPWWIEFRAINLWHSAISIYKKIKAQRRAAITEAALIKYIPSVKDIIAEGILVEDGLETSNRDS